MEKSSVGHIVIPYIQGLGESFKKIYGKCGIQAHFKGNRTLKLLLVKPKVQDPKDKESGFIYSYQCGEVACNEEYIGETGKTLGERYKEHLKEPSPIHVHSQQTGHSATSDSFSIIGREGPGLNQDHKGIYLHQGKQSRTQQEYWEVQS